MVPHIGRSDDVFTQSKPAKRLNKNTIALQKIVMNYYINISQEKTTFSAELKFYNLFL